MPHLSTTTKTSYILPDPVAINPKPSPAFSSDEFRMYSFKIKRCMRTRHHDWIDCPFAHRNEKARRRDPRRFHYLAVPCPYFRHGNCPRSDACEFAHGVFEYWLHPTRYRTRPCNAGVLCQRKVCFFAHTPSQLRCGSAGDGYGHGRGFLDYRIRERKDSSGSDFTEPDRDDMEDLYLSHVQWISDLLA